MQSAPSSSAPAFPPELERQIFEISALSGPASIPNLMLVAWRVKDWLEPLFYRTITIAERSKRPVSIDDYPIFSPEILRAAVQRKPAAFFRDAVRNLCFDDDFSVVDALPPVCTGVENLRIFSKRMLPLFASFSVTRLAGYLVPFFDTFSPTHRFFTQITHLEFLDFPDNTAIWSQLALIPQLTHLAFYGDEVITVYPRLLQTCASLSVLICFVETWRTAVYGSYLSTLSQDVRFVVMQPVFFHTDWQMGVRAGLDFWSRAETFIAKRRSGEIDASQFEFVESKNIT
ncbi:hypothetical protein FB451DRAFT_1269100 [Mycena latifolia]|nr:hypothetical protein FB451DRAFT_1269100 [Mycena latifolia]